MFKNVRYSVSQLKKGMVVGKDIIVGEKVALSAGVELTDRLIESLEFLDVKEIFIKEKVELNQQVNLPPKPLVTTQQKFFEGYYQTVNMLQNIFENISRTRIVSLPELMTLYKQRMLPLINTAGVINHLYLLREQDEYTFTHSLNVGIICGVLGRWLKYKSKDLDELILAGLLHDLGKMEIPDSILNKPGKLTPKEMEVMQLHSTLGFKFVNLVPNISQQISYGILQHHERIDGTGYPMKVKGEQIHPFAKIIAIADVYDAVTSDRPYRLGMAPDQAYDLLQALSGSHFSPQALTEFFAHLATYPIGSFVCLNTGAFGIVLDVPSKLPCRPLLQLVTDETGLPVSEHVTLDLTENLTAKIIRLLTPKEISALPLCQA